MIKDIAILSRNLINIYLLNKQDLESFIRIFTVLDKCVAAKTLFKEEVKIEYRQHDSLEVIKLTKDTGFSYNDIENMLNHMSRHGMEMTKRVIADTLCSSYNYELESKDVAFVCSQGLPKFHIRVNKNIFIITPVSEDNLELNSQNSEILIEALKNEKDTYDCIVEGNKIKVVVNSKIHQVINSIIKSLIKSSLLEKKGEKELRERLRQLAFRDQAFVEYSSIKTIRKYPNDHPLREHESVIRDIEGILFDFIVNENRDFTIERLNRLGLEVSPNTPRIITKTIDKLVKFH